MAAHFTPELFKFLKELKSHNDKRWFDANKSRYEQHVKAPVLAFIGDVAPVLKKVSPNYIADPRPIGGSMFRIYRDTRFSTDKSPYKTHVAMQFRHVSAQKDVAAPGFYLHLEPGACYFGGGLWRPEPGPLAAIRDRIVAKPAEWKKIHAAYDLDGETLKRPPAGYNPDHPFIDDIKRKDFISGRAFTDAQVLKSDFLKAFGAACQELAPLNRFLAQAIGVKP